MHLDKKLITIIVSSALIGGIIGGGVGGAIGSFAGHEEGGRHNKRGGMERNKGKDNYSDGETNDDNSKSTQIEQVANPAKIPVVTASTTKAN
jgi:hypothetical protein